jgi:uncharacterized protein YukE
MTTPNIDVGQGDFAEILERVRRLLERVQQVANELINNVNRVLGWLPGAIADAITAVLDRFGELVTQFLTEVGEFFTQPGWPPGLFSAKTDWTTQVGGRASALVSTATLDETQSDDHWQGVAADAYRNTLPRQKDALTAIKAAVDEISDALNKVAFGIIAFWVAIAGAIVAYVAELIVEAAAAATVVGAPPAAAGGVASTIKVIALVAGFVGLLVTYLTTLSTQYTDLEQRLANNDAFPRGQWPRSTTDLSDASLNDGDDTDWHIK